MKAHFEMFARYNHWANRRLYAAARALPEADYRRDCGAFFGSVHRTLNHVLVGDRIWMHRFTGSGPLPLALDEVAHDDFVALDAARESEDLRIIAYVGDLDAEAMAGTFRYRPMSDPQVVEQALAPALAHFFNHQTHHRGQAHALLTRLCGTAPSLDMIVMQRQAGQG